MDEEAEPQRGSRAWTGDGLEKVPKNWRLRCGRCCRGADAEKAHQLAQRSLKGLSSSDELGTPGQDVHDAADQEELGS